MSAFTTDAATGPISSARKWAITLSVMVVAFMQVLDTSVTNVVLPHLQGSLSAGLEEVSWVITSYLAANAIIIPATGWLAAVLGPQALLPDLLRAVHGQLVPVGHGARTSPSWSLARIVAGHRRRADHPAVPGHPVGDLPARPARPRDGGVGRRLHDGADPRADPRRLHRGQLVVALDLLHQPAGRLLGFFMASAFLFDSAVSQRKPGPGRLAGPRADGAWASAACSSCWTAGSARTGSTPR